MLIKEYRIPLPLTLEEYRIAQLYMIQKKSRVESEGEGSAVEIIENHPYRDDNTGEEGQYTHKIYHIERHIPKWCRSMVPKEAMEVHEEAWNAYPYTRTRFSCPFIEKFSLDVETYFFQDDGSQENVFKLKGSELRNRELDYIDIVNDPLSSGEYKEEEDPQLFQSKKTGRGPLSADWRTNPPNGIIMCSYKLCKVEFRYWGMQSRVERLIHDYALRRVMLRAHRQAWVWQDEWVGLTMADIRQLEHEAQIELRKKLGRPIQSDDEFETASGDVDRDQISDKGGNDQLSSSLDEDYEDVPTGINEEKPKMQPKTPRKSVSKDRDDPSFRTSCNLDVLEQVDSDDDYQDATDHISTQSNDEADFYSLASEDYSSTLIRDDDGQGGHLFLVVHGGSTCINMKDAFPMECSFDIIQKTLLSVIKSQFPSSVDSTAVYPVHCPPITDAAISIITSLQPSSATSTAATDKNTPLKWIPGVAAALMMSNSPEYEEHLNIVVKSLNETYGLFLKSDKGQKFKGQVHILGDCVGAVVMYDVLSRSKFSDALPIHGHHHQVKSVANVDLGCKLQFTVTNFFSFGSPLGIVLANRLLQTEKEVRPQKPRCKGFYNIMYLLDPIASRIEPLLSGEFSHIPPISISSLYHYCWDQDDPTLLVNTLEAYQELFIDKDGDIEHDSSLLHRSLSSVVSDTHEGIQTPVTTQPATSLGSVERLFDEDFVADGPLSKATRIVKDWWSQNRIDYVVQEPDSVSDLGKMTMSARAVVLHSRYWEAKEMISFIVQTVLWNEFVPLSQHSPQQHITPFLPALPNENWLKKTTSFKIRGLSPSHRAQDAIVLEDGCQAITAKFGYGPLHLQSLDGEQVDIHILTAPPGGDWVLFDTLITDKQGKIEYVIPEDQHLPEGMYPVKFVVRGDGSIANCYMAIVRHHTNAAVFSIDGSFAAKFTVTGKRPKMVSGSVEVVRHYAEMGHLIIYISSRPEFQKETVQRWLGKYQFPLGILSFNETLSKDLNQHKKYFLGRLIRGKKITIRAAYGAWRDLQVYRDLGLQPDQIFLLKKGMRKSTKKHSNECQVIEDDYQAHTQDLLALKRPLEMHNVHRSLLRNCNFNQQKIPTKKMETKV